jgi:hypothetical protein
MGGDLRHEDANAVACAIRETREESRVAKFPDLNFVARLDHETRGAWVDLKKWEAWGYSTSGYQKRKGEIFIARVRTAIFCAPLSEGFRGRTVEGRSISLVDLSVPKAFEAIRPKFRHLLELWKERAQGRGQIPTVIRYTA